MNKLMPEKGIHFDPKKIDVARAICPPYDVINKSERKALAELSPYNIVHVVLPEGEGDEKYRQGAVALKKMLDDKALVQDKQEGFYIYDQTFLLPDGRKVTRRGVIGRLKIQDQIEVRAHEKTLDGPKKDRFKLFLKTGVVSSQVFTIYTDPERLVEKALESADLQAIFDVTLDDGIRHVLYRVTDKETCKSITDALKDKELFIADGHHRFETQCNYRNFRRKQVPTASGDEPFNFASVYAVNTSQEGLVILSINRLFYEIQGFNPGKFKDQTTAFLNWSAPFADLDSAMDALKKAGKTGTAFVFILKKAKPEIYVVTARHDAISEFKATGGLHPTVASLDVSFLHKKVVNDILGLDQATVTRKESIEYEHDPNEVLRLMQEDNKYQLGVILNPVKVDQLMAVAEAGEKMPQKSTFFFPKLFSGVVIHPLEKDVPPED